MESHKITLFASHDETGAYARLSPPHVSDLKALSTAVLKYYELNNTPELRTATPILTWLPVEYLTETGKVISEITVGDEVADVALTVCSSIVATVDEIEYELWFSDTHWQAEYPEFIIKIIPPVESIDDFQRPYTEIENEVLNSITELSPKANAIARIAPYSYMTPITVEWHDPATGTVVDTTWVALVYGPAGNTLIQIQNAVIDHIIANSTHARGEWVPRFPKLFKQTQFTLIPVWDNVSIPVNALASPVYSPIVEYSKVLDVITEFSATPDAASNLDNVAILTNLYKSLSIASVGYGGEPGSKVNLNLQFPDYNLVASTALDFNRISESTREWIVLIQNLLIIAESMRFDTVLPAAYSRVVLDGKVYLTTDFQGITYSVITKDSYLNTLYPDGGDGDSGSRIPIAVIPPVGGTPLPKPNVRATTRNVPTAVIDTGLILYPSEVLGGEVLTLADSSTIALGIAPSYKVYDTTTGTLHTVIPTQSSTGTLGTTLDGNLFDWGTGLGSSAQGSVFSKDLLELHLTEDGNVYQVVSSDFNWTTEVLHMTLATDGTIQPLYTDVENTLGSNLVHQGRDSVGNTYTVVDVVLVYTRLDLQDWVLDPALGYIDRIVPSVVTSYGTNPSISAYSQMPDATISYIDVIGDVANKGDIFYHVHDILDGIVVKTYDDGSGFLKEVIPEGFVGESGTKYDIWWTSDWGWATRGDVWILGIDEAGYIWEVQVTAELAIFEGYQYIGVDRNGGYHRVFSLRALADGDQFYQFYDWVDDQPWDAGYYSTELVLSTDESVVYSLGLDYPPPVAEGDTVSPEFDLLKVDGTRALGHLHDTRYGNAESGGDALWNQQSYVSADPQVQLNANWMQSTFISTTGRVLSVNYATLYAGSAYFGLDPATLEVIWFYGFNTLDLNGRAYSQSGKVRGYRISDNSPVAVIPLVYELDAEIITGPKAK